jgi:choline dehydrogenase-like flavoprotein
MLPSPTHEEEFHGTSGPVHVSFPTFYHGIMQVVMPAFESVGALRNPEPMGGNNVGGNITALSIDSTTGARSYAANAYYSPNSRRGNLVVLTGAEVTKILIEGLTAVGVDFTAGGKKYSVKASKEVVLSAGTIASPRLLELSGIGSKAVLQAAGIECKVNIPGVGEGMQDHLCEYPRIRKVL